MFPEGGYCTAIMDSGTLCVLMTGTSQDTRPELYVRAWATIPCIMVINGHPMFATLLISCNISCS